MKRTMGWKRLLWLPAAAALVVAALLSPVATAVTCCSPTVHFTYYSNAAHTQVVGSCTYNEFCTGTDYCSGQITGYYTHYSTCCPGCTN
jgi:hypothetical protein